VTRGEALPADDPRDRPQGLLVSDAAQLAQHGPLEIPIALDEVGECLVSWHPSWLLQGEERPGGNRGVVPTVDAMGGRDARLSRELALIRGRQ
jgi:hypothetical protein